MKVFMSDPYQTKRLEKMLGRKLTTAEHEGEAPVRIRKPDGTLHVEWVRKLNMRDFYGK